MKYVVELKEILSRRVVVEADDECDAIDKVHLAYDASEIVLDYSDYHGDMDVKCCGEADEWQIKYCQNIGGEEE